jgi:cytochrome c oxidase accessory protein FixG
MEQATYQRDESFRDSINTIDQQGSRAFVYPRKPKGKLHNRRLVVSWVLLAIFFGTPFVKYQGDPLFLIDIIHRRFIFFGQIFWPQDTYIFAVLMIATILFIVVFTVALGRLWCGWACPQTIFLEMVFRKIEYWIDGDAASQKRMAASPMTADKALRRILKFSIFLLIAHLIALMLAAWVVGVDAVLTMLREPLVQNLSAFTGLMLLTAVLMFLYSWFREQVCVILCPYGRLQGVLLDRNSIVVAYDYKRGEPRGGFRKNEDRVAIGKGDCTDCRACVQVCPTAIDIRNGTQLECINCTACIDACNATMERSGLPKGLIRFASERMISTGKRLRMNARLWAYSAVLLLLLSFLSFLLFTRADVEATILRTPGLLYQQNSDATISNLYNIKVVNKTRKDAPVSLKLLSHEGRILMPSGDMLVRAAGKSESVFLVYLDSLQSSSSSGKIPIRIGVFSNGNPIEEIDLTFVAPNNKK